MMPVVLVAWLANRVAADETYDFPNTTLCPSASEVHTASCYDNHDGICAESQAQCDEVGGRFLSGTGCGSECASSPFLFMRP